MKVERRASQALGAAAITHDKAMRGVLVMPNGMRCRVLRCDILRGRDGLGGNVSGHLHGALMSGSTDGATCVAATWRVDERHHRRRDLCSSIARRRRHACAGGLGGELRHRGTMYGCYSLGARLRVLPAIHRRHSSGHHMGVREGPCEGPRGRTGS